MKESAIDAAIGGTLLFLVAVTLAAFLTVFWVGALHAVAGVVRHLNDRRRFPGEMSARLRQMAEGREGGRG